MLVLKMCLKITLEVGIILTLFHQIVAEPSCSKYDYEEKMLSKVIRMEIKMEELDVKSKARDIEVTNKFDSYATQAEETKSAILQDLLEYKANISGMIQKQMDILRMDRQGAAEKLKTIEAIKKNISEAMDAVTNDMKDMVVVPAVNFQAHNPSILNPVSGVPFIFTTVIVNNGDGYSDTTGIFSAPVAGLYAFSLQVCAHNVFIYPAIVKENSVLLPTRHCAYGATCTSSSVYTQLSAGDKVWVKCTECSSSHKMWEQAVQAWNAFSGTLVHK